MSWISDVVYDAAGSLDRASQGVKLSVNQDNVMQAARIVRAEAEHFRTRVAYWADLMGAAEPMGGDPVSEDVHVALQDRLYRGDNSYISRCYEYAEMLDRLAGQLGESARLYGFTDEQIEMQFTAGRLDAAARPLPRVPARYGELSDA